VQFSPTICHRLVADKYKPADMEVGSYYLSDRDSGQVIATS